jgi:PAS domain S-box-containing protein
LAVAAAGLILIELTIDRRSNPDSWAAAQASYGLGMIVLTAVVIYALAWQQTRSLRRSEARYRSLFEQADGILVFDRAGQVHDANSAGSRLTGYTLDELQQLKVADLLAADQVGSRAAQLEIPASSGPIEWQVQRRDGALRAVEVKVRQFEANQFMALLHDITARRRLETALQESEAHLRALIGAMSDVIMVLDADGRFCRLEPTGSEALNQVHARLIGLTVEQVLSEEAAAQSRNAIQRALSTRVPVVLEYPQQINQRTMWFATTVSALSAGQVLWVTRDITEARYHEQELAAIASLSTTLRFVTTQSALLPGIVQQIPQWLAVEAVALGIVDPFAEAITLRAAYGAWEKWLGEALPLTRGLAAEVFRSGQVVAYDDLTTASIVERPELLSDIRAFMAVPLQAEQTPLGILAVGRTNTFHPEEVRLLAALGDIAAGALQRVTAQDRAVQRAERLGILNVSGRLLVESLNLPQVMEQLAAALLQLYPDMLALIVSRYDPAQQLMTCVYGWENGEALDVSQLPPLPLEPLGHGVQSECIHRREVIIVDDLPTRLKRAQASVTLGQEPLSAMYAPLLIKGEIIGVVQVQSSVYRRFSTEDAQALSLLASTAAVAIQNARLFEAEREQRALAEALHDTATALSSTLNLSEVLDRVLENVGKIVPYDNASILLISGADAQCVRLRGRLDPGAEDAIKAMRLPVDKTEDLRYVAESGQVLSIGNVHEYPAWSKMPSLDWIHSHLSAPMKNRGRTVGFLNLESAQIDFFTDRHAAHLRTFADQAAVALENARLFEAERKQLRLAQTLRDVGALLTASMSLDEVFDRLFDLLAHVIDFDSVSIQLLQDGRVVFAAGRGFRNIARVQEIIEVGLADALEERWGQPHQRVLVISDTLTDPRWRLVPGSESIRSWIGAALRVKGRLLGVLNVDSHTPNTYAAAAGETVATFANQAAIALENAQLHDAVRRHAETLEARVLERTAELERERKRTATILDAAGEGIMFSDTQGRIEYINPALERLTGYTAAEVLGRNSRIWQSGHTPVSLYEKLWRTITGGQIWQGELVNRRKDGSEYSAALTIAPVFDNEGRISGYVGVQRDISQQKELDRLKDEFVSNVSHELRTPIANVKLYINLLTRGKPEKYDDYLQTLRREAARLEKLIEDLLDLSRLDLSTTPLILESVDVNQLAAQLTADRTELAARKNLLIDYHSESDYHFAQADAALLGQVISNLLTNAINYTPAAGLITVTTAQRTHDNRHWITVTVQDTGPGIPAQDLPHLFDRFYRGVAGRKSGAPGTGLGLAISAQIVRKLGGRITVESQPGAGAAFTVWLNPVL